MEMAFKLCRETQIGYFAFTRDLTISLREFKEYRPQREQKAMWMTPATTRP
jgi:ribonucleoside-triphosphate reductase